MKTFKIVKDYNHQDLVGIVDIEDEAEKLLATGEYILAPGYTIDEKGNRLIVMSLIHEDTLVREDGSKVLKD